LTGVVIIANGLRPPGSERHVPQELIKCLRNRDVAVIGKQVLEVCALSEKPVSRFMDNPIVRHIRELRLTGSRGEHKHRRMALHVRAVGTVNQLVP
jgi:hypothetical protein